MSWSKEHKQIDKKTHWHHCHYSHSFIPSPHWRNVSDEKVTLPPFIPILQRDTNKFPSLSQVACVEGVLKGRERESGAWKKGATFPLPCTPFALLASLKSPCPSPRNACHAWYIILRLQSFNNSKLVVTLPFLKTQITATVYETIEPSQWP